MFFKFKKNKHEHVFKRQEGVAYWQKRDCPGDGIYFHGMVCECECGALRFHVPGLREVEVTR